MIYAFIASKKALEDGGITEQVSGELDKSRCGVLIGTAMGGMQVSETQFVHLDITLNPFFKRKLWVNFGANEQECAPGS